MRQSIFVLLLICAFASSSKADTLNYWHVYFNGVKIKEFNEENLGEIKLKLAEIKDEDSITIKYFCFHKAPLFMRNFSVHCPNNTLYMINENKAGVPVTFNLARLIQCKSADTATVYRIECYETFFAYDTPFEIHEKREKEKPFYLKPPIFKIIIE